MFEIDPSRQDLVEEFQNNPGGPYSAELRLVVNRLRLIPLEDRHILVCTKRGCEWTLAKMPSVRGAKVEMYDDQVFNDYDDAAREVFKRRWHTVTGETLA